MGRILKSKGALFALIALFIINISSISLASSINIHYKDETIDVVSGGVDHIYSKMLTDKGLLDINILRVDLNNNKIETVNLYDKENIGAKRTLTSLLNSEENIIAGINGDFYEMSYTPSFALGITANDGKIENFTAGEEYNYYSNVLATFFLNEDNEPFIEYLNTNVTFSNRIAVLNVTYFNKLGNKEEVIYLDYPYFKNTKRLDELKNYYNKILVSDGVVKDIVRTDAHLDIGEDEYVIAVPVKYEEEFCTFNIGDEIIFNIEISADEDIKMAIGGASKVLSNGSVVSDGYIISGRQPRSAIGYDRSGRYLYLIAVDGRTVDSVGLTHAEFAEILLGFNIYEAFHLDGGGSTTIASKKYYEENMHILNNITSQRAIMNALAIKNISSPGKVNGIKIILDQDKTVVGSPVGFKVIGYDSNYNMIEIDSSEIAITAEEALLRMAEQTISFEKDGRYSITAKYSGFSDKISIDVYKDVKSIDLNLSEVRLNTDEKKTITANVVTAAGFKMPVNHKALIYTVNPQSLGKVENGIFIPDSKGTGYIEVSYKDVSASVKLVVGFNEQLVENFSSKTAEAISYPESVGASITKESKSLKLNYTFKQSDVTQAAYMMFEPGIKLIDNTKRVRLKVTGDQSGNILRAKIVDANGTAHNITFTENIDFAGDKYLEASVPAAAKSPIYIERIYVATLANDKEYTSSIAVKEVLSIYDINSKDVTLPENKTLDDNMKVSDVGEFKDGDLVFYNNPSGGNLLIKYLNDKMGKAFAELNDINFIVNTNFNGQDFYEVSKGYEVSSHDGIKRINLGTKNGSISAYDPNQFNMLESEIYTASNADTIIITVNANLFDSSLEKDRKLLNYILDKFYTEVKKNIVVVMYSDTDSYAKSENGIRYFNLSRNVSNIDKERILIVRKDSTSDIVYKMETIEKFLK